MKKSSKSVKWSQVLVAIHTPPSTKLNKSWCLSLRPIRMMWNGMPMILSLFLDQRSLLNRWKSRQPLSTTSARWESNRMTPRDISASSVQSIRRLRAVFERWKHEARHEIQAVRSPETAAVFQTHAPPVRLNEYPEQSTAIHVAWSNWTTKQKRKSEQSPNYSPLL
jgi:hypothetical protein